MEVATRQVLLQEVARGGGAHESSPGYDNGWRLASVVDGIIVGSEDLRDGSPHRPPLLAAFAMDQLADSLAVLGSPDRVHPVEELAREGGLAAAAAAASAISRPDPGSRGVWHGGLVVSPTPDGFKMLKPKLGNVREHCVIEQGVL